MLVKQFLKPQYRESAPLEKIKIAIMYQVASYWPTIESFYEACVSDQDVEVRIFFVGDMSVERVQVENSDKFLISKGIPFTNYSEREVREYEPHVALYQPPYDVSYRNPDALSLHLMNMGIRIVYIPYGIEIADTEDAHYNHFQTFVVRNAWRIYTFSEMMRKDYMKYCPNRHAVRAFGIPKFDAIVQKNAIDGSELAKIAKGNKIVLWKMHFPKLIYEDGVKKQVTPDLKEYIKFVEQIETFQDLLFVIMPHPMFFSKTIDNQLAEQAKVFFDIVKEKKNVYLDKSDDYRTSLYQADAIIIDRSAIMVEAGCLNVPVLYMKNADYEEPLTKAVSALVDSFEQGTSYADMVRFIEDFQKTGLKTVAEKISTVREEVMPFESGLCGKRILEDIKVGVRKKEDAIIKTAFFGASYICEHYIEQLAIKENDKFAIICLSDNDRSKWGTTIAGIEVVSPERLRDSDVDLIVISSEQYYFPIKKKLIYELYMEEDKIMRLDEFSEIYNRMYRPKKD